MAHETYDSIGCYYQFDRSAIVTAKIINDKNNKDKKAVLKCESFNKTSLKIILEKLSNFSQTSKIWTNKDITIKEYFHDRINQVDFSDDNSIAELNNIYQSLYNDELLIFGEDLDLKQPHHIKALQLALRGLNYYKLKNHLLYT
jgi:hypothetical protein